MTPVLQKVDHTRIPVNFVICKLTDLILNYIYTGSTTDPDECQQATLEVMNGKVWPYLKLC